MGHCKSDYVHAPWARARGGGQRRARHRTLAGMNTLPQPPPTPQRQADLARAMTHISNALARISRAFGAYVWHVRVRITPERDMVGGERQNAAYLALVAEVRRLLTEKVAENPNRVASRLALAALTPRLPFPQVLGRSHLGRRPRQGGRRAARRQGRTSWARARRPRR